MGSVAGSFPSAALQSVPSLQPGGRLGLMGWLGGFLPVWPWFPRFSGLVSLSHQGLVKKQVEQDPEACWQAG